MNMSEFDVILGMDWPTAHRVFIDCDLRRVTAYTPDDVYVMFQGDKHCKTPEKSEFLEKGRTIKFGQNLDFFSSTYRMTKQTSPLEFSCEI